MQQIRRLDVFPKFDQKFEKDARQRTALGGILSVAAVLVIAFLVVSETRFFFSMVEEHSMYVDSQVGGDLTIKVNVSFHRVPCDLLTMDSVDAFGIYSAEAGEKAIKTRVAADTLQPISQARALVNEEKVMTKPVDPDGVEKEDCPSCYGAEATPGQCCHTCDDVRVAYERRGWTFNIDDISIEQCAEERVRLAATASSKEGCNIQTTFRVARVTGNLHFIPGRVYKSLGRRLYSKVSDTMRHLNLSHTIHTLEFGDQFPGQVNPLVGTHQIRGAAGDTQRSEVNGRFSYFVKVVPTLYATSSAITGFESRVETNQYSVTHHFTPSVSNAEDEEAGNAMPGVFFTYNLSPIVIRVSREHPYSSLVHFLLQLCAVCGGVLTVTGLTDSLIFHGLRRMKKAREGKLY